MIQWQGHRAFILCTSFVSIALCLTAQVEATIFTGTSGSLAASAEFTLNSGDLLIHLVNTSPTPVGDKPNVLTAIFFDLAGSPALTAGSIALDASSVYANTSKNSVVLPLGDHWAYKSGTGGSKPSGYGFYGVSAARLSIFGPGDTFTGSGFSRRLGRELHPDASVVARTPADARTASPGPLSLCPSASGLLSFVHAFTGL